jgi:hypothetical protein
MTTDIELTPDRAVGHLVLAAGTSTVPPTPAKDKPGPGR